MAMKMGQIILVVQGLARSQGLYSRIYYDWIHMQKEDPGLYEELTATLEAEEFESPLDVVLYLEEGKSKFEDVFDIAEKYTGYVSDDMRGLKTINDLGLKTRELLLVKFPESEKVINLLTDFLIKEDFLDVLDYLGYKVIDRKQRKEVE